MLNLQTDKSQRKSFRPDLPALRGLAYGLLSSQGLPFSRVLISVYAQLGWIIICLEKLLFVGILSWPGNLISKFLMLQSWERGKLDRKAILHALSTRFCSAFFFLSLSLKVALHFCTKKLQTQLEKALSRWCIKSWKRTGKSCRRSTDRRACFVTCEAFLSLTYLISWLSEECRQIKLESNIKVGFSLLQ